MPCQVMLQIKLKAEEGKRSKHGPKTDDMAELNVSGPWDMRDDLLESRSCPLG